MGEHLIFRGRLENRSRHGLRAKMTYETNVKTDRSKIAAELDLVRRIVRVLKDEYPGHPWGVTVDGPNGYAQITIVELLGPNWGEVLHIDTIDKKAIVEAGGRILERFKIPRSNIDFAAYGEAFKSIPMIGNFRANHRQLIPA